VLGNLIIRFKLVRIYLENIAEIFARIESAINARFVNNEPKNKPVGQNSGLVTRYIDSNPKKLICDSNISRKML
jgi:hypothetical protein